VSEEIQQGDRVHNQEPRIDRENDYPGNTEIIASPDLNAQESYISPRFSFLQESFILGFSVVRKIDTVNEG
jgi:hypothetical protein